MQLNLNLVKIKFNICKNTKLYFYSILYIKLFVNTQNYFSSKLFSNMRSSLINIHYIILHSKSLKLLLEHGKEILNA